MKKFAHIIAAAATIFSICSCGGKFGPTDNDFDRVFIYYLVGFNDLQPYLEVDMEELLAVEISAYVPGKDDDKAILFVSHFPQYYGAYSTETAPVVERVTYDGSEITRDTLLRLATGAKLTDKDVMTEALGYIKENFPSDHYVMSYSSHGTGWLPEGYYGKNSTSNVVFDAVPLSVGSREEGVPIVPHLPGPLTKSLGCEYHYTTSGQRSFEMDITDIAQCIPMHLDCLFLDACLMGGVEVAMELSGVTSKLAFSAAEMSVDGFDYTMMSQRALKAYDPAYVCKTYYEDAEALSGWDKSATISLVNTANIGMLATECKEIFAAHRDQLDKIDPSKVQCFGRFKEHWYYDLRDIVVNAGATELELGEFDNLLSQCVEYQASTDTLFNSIKVNTHCGLTMYLPVNGNDTLDEYYRNLSWNKATGLVE